MKKILSIVLLIALIISLIINYNLHKEKESAIDIIYSVMSKIDEEKSEVIIEFTKGDGDDYISIDNFFTTAFRYSFLKEDIAATKEDIEYIIVKNVEGLVLYVHIIEVDGVFYAAEFNEDDFIVAYEFNMELFNEYILKEGLN